MDVDDLVLRDQPLFRQHELRCFCFPPAKRELMQARGWGGGVGRNDLEGFVGRNSGPIAGEPVRSQLRVRQEQLPKT